jgi:hypothetical protein
MYYLLLGGHLDNKNVWLFCNYHQKLEVKTQRW